MKPYFLALFISLFALISPLANASELGPEPQIIIEGADPYQSSIADDMRKDGSSLEKALVVLPVIWDNEDYSIDELKAMRRDLYTKLAELSKRETGIWSFAQNTLGFGNRAKIKRLIAIIDDGIGRAEL